MLSVAYAEYHMQVLYAEWHYAECCLAEVEVTDINKHTSFLHYNVA
jgi:hypothetical protein